MGPFLSSSVPLPQIFVGTLRKIKFKRLIFYWHLWNVKIFLLSLKNYKINLILYVHCKWWRGHNGTTGRPPSVYGRSSLNQCLCSRILCRSCWESFIMVLRIAFLSEFWKMKLKIPQRYGDIPNQWDAGVFKVRISLVWCQFQLKVD